MLQVLAIKPSEDPTAYIAMLLGGMVLIYLGVLRPMMRKRKDPLEQPSPRAAGLGQQRALEREMQHVLVEYEQMIRNMTAGLDTRAAKLELLIREADEKLAALRAANAGSGPTTLRMTPIEPVSASAAAEDVMAPAREAPTEPDPRHAEVYALADEGLSPREVARRLGRPNGEIELILALRSGAE